MTLVGEAHSLLAETARNFDRAGGSLTNDEVAALRKMILRLTARIDEAETALDSMYRETLEEYASAPASLPIRHSIEAVYDAYHFEHDDEHHDIGGEG